ncbi:diacylglycerol O-acyltransferase 1 [Entomortierella chlamydospora]|nr:diacylglycerol O-acyltransferase 1 [Entomortierella chlamydospora]
MLEADLDPSKNYIFGYHPHGVLSMGALCTFGTEGLNFSKRFPGIKPVLMTLQSNFQLPIYRDYIMAHGIVSVSKASCEYVLNSGPGNSIAIVVGGAQESLSSKPGTLDLTLKKRLGFIKLALVNGASLVPTLAFGENELYEVYVVPKKSKTYQVQQLLKSVCGFTLPMFNGRGIFNCYSTLIRNYVDFLHSKLRYHANHPEFNGTFDYKEYISLKGIDDPNEGRKPVFIVIGKPIHVEKVEGSPTLEQLKELQNKYIDEVMDIWERYKDQYAPGRTRELQIIE